MSQKRFQVALSFAGEQRNYVSKVALLLANELGRDAVFYDAWYQAELARPNLDTHLQKIYHEDSQLLVPFFCADYKQKEWCGLEWRAIRDLLKKRQDADIMPMRFDNADIAGFFSIDGYIDLQKFTPEQTANLIIERLGCHPTAKLQAKGNPAIFNVPVPRNPFFTGRGDILAKLHDALQNDHEIAITPSKRATALSGLGGVGKTQTVAEYAHCYQADYSAVLWVLADGKDLLHSSFAQLSVLLGFKAEKQDDQILAVQSWLRNNNGWLLIFDNAETLELLTAAKELLPSNAQGHVLFTTRAQATGGIASVTVDCFDDDTGAVFLLRRSKIVAMDLATLEQVRPCVSDQDWQTATELVHELGGLALAIDQAGAYIEQTECGLEGYLSRYRTNAAVMLQERGGYVHSADHPVAVYKTFLLAAESVEKRSQLAEEILCISAFLHPDGVPEELFASYEPLEFDKALAALKDYSLIQRVSKKRLFRVHHLVQVVTRDVCHTDQTAPTKWVEKAVLSVDDVFPEGDVEFEDLQQYERLLGSSLACAKWIIDLSINNEAAARLLAQIATYLQNAKADYQQAEIFKEKSLTIYKNLYGDDSIQVAKSKNDLATLYVTLKKFEEAKILFIQSLEAKEKLLKENDPSIATTLNNFAWLYDEQNMYAESEPLRKRSLKIMEDAYGQNSTNYARCLNNFAEWYRQQRKYAKAEPLFLKELKISEEILGKNHLDVAISLNNLAGNYRDSGNYEAAVPLYQRSIVILENTLIMDHPHTIKVKANYKMLLSLMEQ